MNVLKEAIARSGMTISALAEKVGVNRVSVHRWIASGWVGAPHAVAVAEALGIDPMTITRTALELRLRRG